MSTDVKAFYQKFDSDMGKLKQEIPDTLSGFGGLFGKTMGKGALTVLEKEMVALGIAVAIQCEPCIMLHVKKALEAGASRQQVFEAASVAAMMAGGPAYTHIPMVMDALEANGA